jgi:hypothetical protein
MSGLWRPHSAGSRGSSRGLDGGERPELDTGTLARRRPRLSRSFDLPLGGATAPTTNRWLLLSLPLSAPGRRATLADRPPPRADHDSTRQRPGDDRHQRRDAPRVAAQRLRVRVPTPMGGPASRRGAELADSSIGGSAPPAPAGTSTSPPGSSGPPPPDLEPESGRDRPMRTIPANGSCNAPQPDPPVRGATAPGPPARTAPWRACASEPGVTHRGSIDSGYRRRLPAEAARSRLVPC